jgi:predicted XRE-type DNA-binding protein
MTMTEKTVFNNVWDALFTEQNQNIDAKIRSDFMTSLIFRIEQWNLTQAEAAKRLGISQPRLNDLLKGKLSKFSIDALLSLAVNAGLKVELTIKEAA